MCIKYEKTLNELFMRDVEKSWKISNKRYLVREYQEIFGEQVLREIAEQNMDILLREYKKLMSSINYLNSKYKCTLSSDELAVAEEVVGVLGGCALGNIVEKASLVIPYLRSCDDRMRQNTGFIDVGVIVERVLLSVYVQQNYSGVRSLGNKLVVKCPFHDDRNPSLYVYKETESFYCFGCGKGGNIISFVSLEQGLEFYEVLKYLKQY